MTPATYQNSTLQADQWSQSIGQVWNDYQQTTVQLRNMLMLHDHETTDWDARQSFAPRIVVALERLQLLQNNDPWGIGLMQDVSDLHQEITDYLNEIQPMVEFLADEAALKAS